MVSRADSVAAAREQCWKLWFELDFPNDPLDRAMQAAAIAAVEVMDVWQAREDARQAEGANEADVNLKRELETVHA